MTPPLLTLSGVGKYFRHPWTYRKIPVLEDVSLDVQPGEIFGLIGHNGAGKTTTFKLIAGLLRPNSGRLLLDGVSLSRTVARAGLGFSPEQPYFQDDLTVSETLRYYARLYGMPSADSRQRIAELSERFRLAARLNSPVRTLSKGNLQRVAVLQAILHRPRIAVLDEPMSGLDPLGRKEMRELILSLTRDGTSVLFSSHVLSDAEALCDRVGILVRGSLRETVVLSAEDGPPAGHVLTVVEPSPETLRALEEISGEPAAGGPSRWTVRLADASTLRRALAESLRGGCAIEALNPVRPSLEARFLKHMGEEGAEGRGAGEGAP